MLNRYVGYPVFLITLFRSFVLLEGSPALRRRVRNYASMSLTLTATTRAVTADLRNDAASQPRLDSSSSYLSNGVRPMAVRELHESPALETQEPPRKKVRLSDQTWKSAEDIPPWVNATLEACLDEQVFPHIDGEIAKLPRDKVNTRMLATEVRISNRSCLGSLLFNHANWRWARLLGRLPATTSRPSSKGSTGAYPLNSRRISPSVRGNWFQTGRSFRYVVLTRPQSQKAGF